jgi:GT2 family glycosyltransferase
MKRIPIVISSFGRSELLHLSLSSLFDAKSGANGFDSRVIVVDNGSGKETRDVLRHFEGCIDELILLKINKGKPNAWNIGIALSYQLCTVLDEDLPDYFILADSDVEYLPNWFPELVAVYKTFETEIQNFAILSAFQNVVGPHKIKIRAKGDKFIQLRRYPPGCCWMISRKAFEQIGFFDSDRLIRGVDTEYCKKSWAAGFQNAVVSPTLVKHIGEKQRTWDLVSGESIYYT